jgi:hypothetical protein
MDRILIGKERAVVSASVCRWRRQAGTQRSCGRIITLRESSPDRTS